MSFREPQDAADRWVGQFEEGYFSPLANVARLAEEVGELAREVNHHFGPKTEKPDEQVGSIPMELADILFVVVTAARLGVADPESMAALLRLPLSLLPTFLVPLIIASHVVLGVRLAHRSAVR